MFMKYLFSTKNCEQNIIMSSDFHKYAHEKNSEECLSIIINYTNKDNINNGNAIWLDIFLHISSRFGLIDCIKSLIERGADIHILNMNNRTPLHVASINGQTESVQILLQYGADINARGPLGYTPLHYAAINGHKDVVELLLNYGADTSITATRDELLAETMTFERYRDEIVNLIVGHNFKNIKRIVS